MTMAYRRFGLPRWFWLVLAVTVLAVMLPRVSLNTHAVERHGSDAVEIRRCMSNNGAYELWKKYDSDRFFAICILDDGRFGLQLLQKIGDRWTEITSFVPQDGSWASVRDYLIRQATKWRGRLP